MLELMLMMFMFLLDIGQIFTLKYSCTSGTVLGFKGGGESVVNLGFTTDFALTVFRRNH